MKTAMKILAILFALVMQVSYVHAENGTPVYLFKTSTDHPPITSNPGPRRVPAAPRPLYIDITLSEDGSCLNLYDPEGSTISYSITNEDEDVVAAGTISFVGQPYATISLESLDYGLYTLEVVLDGTTYMGEFGLEE